MEKAKEILKKMGAFIGVFVSFIAAVGGTAYLFYYGEPFMGFANIVLTAFAVPACIKAVKYLLDE